MSNNHASPPAQPGASLPSPIAWAIAICLGALAVVAVLAVAALIGFTPADIQDVVSEIVTAVTGGDPTQTPPAPGTTR